MFFKGANMVKVLIVTALVVLGFTLPLFAEDASQSFISSQDFKTVKTVLEKVGIPLETVWKIAEFEGEKVVSLDLSIKSNAADFNAKPVYYLPMEIGNLKYLRKLNLDDNKLTTLPNEIGQLENLEILTVQRNFIVELPVTMGNLKNLTVLNLSGNQLFSLPQAVFVWNNLEVLDLSNNKLHELPSEIGGMQSLRYLYVQDNPLYTIPMNFTGLHLKGFSVTYSMLRRINPEMKSWVLANRNDYLQ